MFPLRGSWSTVTGKLFKERAAKEWTGGTEEGKARRGARGRPRRALAGIKPWRRWSLSQRRRRCDCGVLRVPVPVRAIQSCTSGLVPVRPRLTLCSRSARQLGLNERKALFEKQSAAASGAAPARMPSSGAAPARMPASGGAPPASASGGPKAAVASAGGGAGGGAAAADAPAMSLKERMAMLQGGGADGGGGAKPAEPAARVVPGQARGGKADPPAARPAQANLAPAKLDSPADAGAGPGKSGGLQDRLKAFEGAGKPVAQQTTAQRQEQPEEKKQSINQRMAALQGGAGTGAGDDSGTPAGAGPVVGKLRPSNSFRAADASPPPAPAAAGSPAAADTTMSLKERLALLQQQEKKDETKTVQNRAPQADSNSNLGKPSVAEKKASNRSEQENLPPAEATRHAASNQAKVAVHARWEVFICGRACGSRPARK